MYCNVTLFWPWINLSWHALCLVSYIIFIVFLYYFIVVYSVSYYYYNYYLLLLVPTCYYFVYSTFVYETHHECHKGRIKSCEFEREWEKYTAQSKIEWMGRFFWRISVIYGVEIKILPGKCLDSNFLWWKCVHYLYKYPTVGKLFVRFCKKL